MKKQKVFITSFKAIDQSDGTLKTWAGPNVKAPSFEAAQEFCKIHYGYAKVEGELA